MRSAWKTSYRTNNNKKFESQINENAGKLRLQEIQKTIEIIKNANDFISWEHCKQWNNTKEIKRIIYIRQLKKHSLYVGISKWRIEKGY